MQNSNLTFLPFSTELAPHFDRINREWITQMFVLEPIDEFVISQPQEAIIDKGGYIYFVSHPTLGVCGACALLRKQNGVFELTKMGVTGNTRGSNIGQSLLVYVLDQVKDLPITTLFLLTNKKCEAAIHLYEKYGFVHDDDIMQTYGSSYERCDVAMRYSKLR